MAWSSPRTWVPSETVTAALMNQQIRDNLNILKTRIQDDGSIRILDIAGLGNKVLDADVTVNGSTAFVDTGLEFAIGAGESWTWDVFGYAASGATPNIKLQFIGPASPSKLQYFGNGGIGGAISVPTNLVATAFSTVYAFTGGSGDFFVQFIGGIVNGANAGTIKLQFAQNTSNGSNTVFRAGSRIRAVRTA